MSATYGMPLPARPDDTHPLRTIREIRESLPDDQLAHFDAELAETDISELESILTRWATLANDGFIDFLLSTPFEGLEFGSRSYDEDPPGSDGCSGGEPLGRTHMRSARRLTLTKEGMADGR